MKILLLDIIEILRDYIDYVLLDYVNVSDVLEKKENQVGYID